MRHVLAFLVALSSVGTPLLSQDPTTIKKQFLYDILMGERGTLIRYGNWFGPGWWGGSEDAVRVGPCPPVDPLDAVAQKHDFGYAVAEKYGAARPSLISRYKSIADGIAVRDARSLPENPLFWSPRPKNPELARRYRDRISVGFAEYVQKFNALMEFGPHKLADVTNPDVLEGKLIPAEILDEAKLEKLALAMVRDWNKESAIRLAKAGKRPICGMDPPTPPTPLTALARPNVPVPATGAWVLERTDFAVQALDATLMQKLRPYESGGDGAGTAGGTFGHPDPKVYAVIIMMKAEWTSPPRVMVPGTEIGFRMTASDAGSNDPRGLYVGGNAELRANVPSRSNVWYGPAASFDLHAGERSKVATKSYTPPAATSGDVMYFSAAYGVGIRRAEYVYTYRFTKDVAHAPAPVITTSAPPVPIRAVSPPATPPAIPPTAPPAPSSANASINGTWNVTFNTSPGVMEIADRDGAYAGRIRLGNSWEPMLELRIAAGAISFRREGGDQRYVGSISGGAMRGTFSQNGSGSYPWTANRSGGPP